MKHPAGTRPDLETMNFEQFAFADSHTTNRKNANFYYAINNIATRNRSRDNYAWR